MLSGENIGRIITGAIAIALLGFAALFIAQGVDQHATALIAVAVGLVGLVAPSPFQSKPSSTKPRKPPPLPLLLLALALALVGCGDPVADQARAAIVTAGTLSAGGDMVMAARADALDRVEAEYPQDPEHDAQLRIEHARWQPVLVGLDAGAAALDTWIDAIDLARAAGGGEDVMQRLVALAGRAARLVSEALSLAAALGVDGLEPEGDER
jgi:hypothetical protein